MGGWAVVLASALALATSCSVFTSVDGLSSGAAVSADDGGPRDDAGGPRPPDGGGPPPSAKPRAWRRLQVSGPPGLHSARMAFDEARGKAVLYGGANPTQTSDTWEWDGAAWSRVQVDTAPSRRLSPGLAYDSARQVTMMSGGSNTTPDPWEWNGTAWRSSGVSSSWPNVAYSTAMTYDRSRAVLVTFGGVHASVDTSSSATWEWSPEVGFVQRKPAHSPGPRRAHVLAYDAARSRVVLFGGSDGNLLNDTWEWDGTDWTQRRPTFSPPARKAPCSAYDSVRRVIVIFGGREGDDAKALADTWEWDGTTWRQGATGPSARSSCAMAFDSARNQVVMYGGSPRHVGKNPSEVSDETWVYE